MIRGNAPGGSVGSASRRLRSAGAYSAVALAAVVLLGSPPPALSQVDDPTDGHVWAGCELAPETVQGLQTDINAGIGAEADSDIEVAFVVVYALDNDNDGQSLGETGTTGPVLCLNRDLDLGIEATSQTAPIPAVGETVDTLDAEDVFILRYLINGGGEGVNGTVEKVICHTVNDQTDCFRISPLLGD